MNRSTRLNALAVALGVMLGTALTARLHAQSARAIALVATPPRPGASGRSVALRVRNDGAAPVSLRNELVVEREGGGGFSPGAGGPLDTTRCATAPARRCITVPPGGALTVEPWDGMTCRGCVCDRNGPAPAGRYRFVVRTCDAASAFASAPFTLAAP